MSNRHSNNRTWVIKIGSSLLTDPLAGLNDQMINTLAAQVAALLRQKFSVVMVSSGSIVEGIKRLGWSSRPHAVYKLQAAAAVGQMGLIQAYESAFSEHDLHTAQVLLTAADLANRERYINARSTLKSLLGLGVIPIVNENDTVVTDEIRVGDNDTLAALVANLVEAEQLVILTDQKGLYEQDPRKFPLAKLVDRARAGDKSLESMAGPGTNLGRGGMITKLRAAEKAARSGAATIIANGRVENVLTELACGHTIGTFLEPTTGRIAARKQWMAGQLGVRGKLELDNGAIEVLRFHGRSLLPVGVTRIEGDFKRGEMVSCVSAEGPEIARGLVNYSADESRKIAGKASEQIESILGYVDEPELIHRDNMVVL